MKDKLFVNLDNTCAICENYSIEKYNSIKDVNLLTKQWNNPDKTFFNLNQIINSYKLCEDGNEDNEYMNYIYNFLFILENYYGSDMWSLSFENNNIDPFIKQTKGYINECAEILGLSENGNNLLNCLYKILAFTKECNVWRCKYENEINR